VERMKVSLKIAENAMDKKEFCNAIWFY